MQVCGHYGVDKGQLLEHKEHNSGHNMEQM